MNAQTFLLALGQADDAYVQQAGVAGGHFSAEQRRRRPQRLLGVLLAAAVLVALSATAFAAKELIGIWNDRWLSTPAPDPVQVVREAVERQEEKVYAVSVTVDEIRTDGEEARKVLAGDPTSALARMNGSSAAFAGKAETDVAAVYVRYTAVYDHTKTYYRDGTLYRYFYLVKNAHGDWEIVETSDPQEVRPVEPADTEPTELSAPESRTAVPAAEQQRAVAAVTEMVRQWAAFDNVETITVDAAAFDPAQTEAALAYLRGSVLAQGNGWTEAWLQTHMAAVTVTWTTVYAPDPLLPGGSRTTETATYWLLQDPETGEWHNSEITGLMDAAD